MFDTLQVSPRLEARTKIEPAVFDGIMALREGTHNARDYNPIGKVESDNLFPGTYYLKKVDARFRREYGRF